MERKAYSTGVLCIALFSACAGGRTIPAAPPAASPTHAATPQQRGTASFKIRIPRASASSAKAKRPAFISPNAGSIRIALSTVNGSTPNPAVPDTVAGLTPASPSCTTDSSGTTCTVSAAAVIGTDVYALSLYGSTDGSGTAIGTAVATSNVLQGTAANVSVTFGGVPASLVVSSGVLSAPADSATHTLTFTVKALDATGATILPPGNYSAPIALTISGDPNGALSLGSANVTAPANADGTSTVTVTYDATKALTSGTIALAAGTPTASVAVNPLVYTPATKMRMFAGATALTLQVSEAGYAGAFTLGGAGTLVTTSCAPVSCAPASAGGTVTITVTPQAQGSGTLTVADVNAVTASVPYGVGPSGPSSMATVATGNSKLATDGTTVYIGGAGNMYTFDASACTTSCTVTTHTGDAGANGLALGGSGVVYVNIATKVYKMAGPCPPTCTPVQYAPQNGGLWSTIGSDGNLWVNNPSAPSILRVNLSTAITTLFTPPVGVEYTTQAADGTFWMGYDTSTKLVHFDPRTCTTVCSFTTFAINAATGITTAPDGSIWFTEYSLDQLVCSPTCARTIYTVTGHGTGMFSGVLALPDGLLWVADGPNTDIIDPSRCSGTTCTPLLTVPSTAGRNAVYAQGAVWTVTSSGILYELPIP